jgi:hypothetical protein
VLAWNFVVLGLFVVMMLPLLERRIIGTQSFDAMRVVFMLSTFVVGVFNYLPTRLAPAALALLLARAGELVLRSWHGTLPGQAGTVLFDFLLAAVPWLAWLCLARSNAHRLAFDRLWLDFRDRWGFVWAQRVREQFDHAARNAGWPIHLGWQGLVEEGPPPFDHEKYLETLRKVLQRFLP